MPKTRKQRKNVIQKPITTGKLTTFNGWYWKGLFVLALVILVGVSIRQQQRINTLAEGISFLVLRDLDMEIKTKEYDAWMEGASSAFYVLNDKQEKHGIILNELADMLLTGDNNGKKRKETGF